MPTKAMSEKREYTSRENTGMKPETIRKMVKAFLDKKDISIQNLSNELKITPKEINQIAHGNRIEFSHALNLTEAICSY